MILIIGLGNPGSGYEQTRHNIGFEVIDNFTKILDKKRHYLKFNSLVIEALLEQNPIMMVKPQTFMNRSGAAIKSFVDYLDDGLERMLVIHDDIDIEFGKIRYRKDGSTAGHRGLESIAGSIQSMDFDRLRMGVGRPPGRMDPADYVLSKFKKDELKNIGVSIQITVDSIKDYVLKGLDFVMNKYN